MYLINAEHTLSSNLIPKSKSTFISLPARGYLVLYFKASNLNKVKISYFLNCL